MGVDGLALIGEKAHVAAPGEVVDGVGGGVVVLAVRVVLVVAGADAGFLQRHAQRPALGEEAYVAVLEGDDLVAAFVQRAAHVEAVLPLRHVIALHAVAAEGLVFAGDEVVAVDVEKPFAVVRVGVDDAGAVVLKIGVVAERPRRRKGDLRRRGQAQRQRQERAKGLFHGRSSKG